MTANDPKTPQEEEASYFTIKIDTRILKWLLITWAASSWLGFVAFLIDCWLF